MVISFIDRLLHEHHRIHRVLGLMYPPIIAMETGGSPDMETFGFALDYLRNFPATIHHPKEDLMFYHMQMREPRLKLDVQQMLAQHRQIYEMEERVAEAAALVARRGAVFHRRLVEATRGYLHLQKEHREIEELFVFPRAQRLLVAEDWAYLDCPADDWQEPVFTALEVKRFESLFVYLTRRLGASSTIPGLCAEGTTWRPSRAAELQAT